MGPESTAPLHLWSSGTMDPYGIVTLVLVACISSLLFISTWLKLYRRSPLPPGPTPLPILGNLLQLQSGKLFQSIMELNKVYGPVFTIYLGTLRVVVLCSYDAIKEALIDQAEDFNGRGKVAGLNTVLGNTGFGLSNVEHWKQLRRFSLMTLRNFGMGKRSIEERIQEEIQCLVEELRKTKGHLLDPTLTLSGAFSNVICSVVFSERFDYGDPAFLTLLKLVNEIFTHISSFWGQMYDMFPFVVRYLPGGYNRMAHKIKELMDFISKRVALNQNTLDPNNPRDYIDCFLIKMEKEKSIPGTEYTLRNLVSTVFSLFLAGTDTVSTTLRYGFLILLKYPEIEEKIHEEIDRVIGRECIPSTEHRTKMPYTDAVIHEIQRFINLTPAGAPHCTTCDTQFRGYIIPKLRKKYGDVFTIYLGRRRAIVVCGFECVKKALIDQGEDFLGRGDVPSIDKVYKHYGIAFTKNMETWKELRRFTVMTLKNFGMGKRSIEERIQEEAQCLLEVFRNTKGLPFDPRHLFGCVSANVTCSIMLGKRYNFKDDEFLYLIRTINDCFHEISSFWGQLYDTFPYILDYLPGPHNKIFKYLEDLMEFIKNRVTINQETLDPSFPRDYIDCFLIRMEQEKQNRSSEFHITNLTTSTVQTFFAGVETVGTTLTYGFLILLKYPDVREKVQEEIDQVIGRDRQPCFQDRTKMPYTDAVCHEIQRFSNLLPFGVPRAAVYDTVFQGYNIPKGTSVFIMLHTVLRDPKIFINPEDFNPGHFLNEDGRFKSSEGFMPLSAGKRMCPGEGLVLMELFLIFTTVLQSFNIQSTLELEDIDIEPITGGIGNFPKPYQIGLISR